MLLLCFLPSSASFVVVVVFSLFQNVFCLGNSVKGIPAVFLGSAQANKATTIEGILKYGLFICTYLLYKSHALGVLSKWCS